MQHGLVQHVFTELGGKSAGDDHCFRFNIGRPGCAEHLRDDSLRHVIAFGPGRQFEDDFGTLACSSRMRIMHQYIAVQIAPIRLDHPAATLLHQTTREDRIGPFEHLVDATLRLIRIPTMCTPTGDGRSNPIATKCPACIRLQG